LGLFLKLDALAQGQLGLTAASFWVREETMKSSSSMSCRSTRRLSIVPLAIAVLLSLAASAQVMATTTPPASRVVVSRASPETGLRGQVIRGDTRIWFQSQVVDGLLTARITARDRRTLWLYTESLGGRGQDALFIVVGKARFAGSYTPEVLVEMEALALSSEGDLLRTLALELQSKAPNAALAAERRGLETAFQAIQQSYPGFGSAQLFGAADTPDYLVTSRGEYVVKTQHPDAVFMANALTGEHREEAEAAAAAAKNFDLTKVFEKDDPHIGDDCFGMCGKGCTDFFGCGFEGWSHEWVGEPTVTAGELTCECSRKEEGSSCGDPYSAQRWDSDGTAVHTIRGRSSVGCIEHDWCCRTFFLGCLNPLCLVIAPAALDCFFAGWSVSWSYVGPHHEMQFITSGDENCYCEPCPTTEEY
jgi:hypothetical protein